MLGFLAVLAIFWSASAASSPPSACTSNPNNTIKHVVNCIKFGYDKVQRPTRADGKPVVVTIDLVVISIGTLNDLTMDYTLEFYMRQRWLDPLLQYNMSTLAPNNTYAVLDQGLIKNLWRPDTYIENLKSLKFSFADGPFINQGFRLFPDGQVLISSRISATLTCSMAFHNFPMDRQTCPMTLSSYFFTETDLYYTWNEVYIYEAGVDLAQFDVLGVEKERASLKFSSGVYSSLKATFKFRRRIQNFLLGFYIPTILTVMLSWVSFFISPNSAPARCALGIITVLAVGGFLTGQRKSFPTVSYVMSADQYILACYVFVFCALLEYAAVHYFYVYEKQLQQHRHGDKNNAKKNNAPVIDEGELDEEEEEELEKQVKPELVRAPPNIAWVEPLNKVAPHGKATQKRPSHAWLKLLFLVAFCPCLLLKKCYERVKSDALFIDTMARTLFPLSFALFNLVYWSMYLPQH